MRTQISTWKYAYWFLLSGVMLGLSALGLFHGFRHGYRREVTWARNPWQFGVLTILLLVGIALGLIVIFIGIAALLQKD